MEMSEKCKEAYDSLRDGNERFTRNQSTHLGQDVFAGASLSDGQSPHSAILTCSDSRVSPEILFDQGLGDIFVVRVAGNLLDPDVIASLEYAVSELKVKLIVVLGHENCGAIKATLAAIDGKELGSPHLNHLVDRIKPNLVPYVKEHEEDPGLVEAAMYNVLAVRRNLVRESSIIRDALVEKSLVIVPAFFSLNSQNVSFLPYETSLKVISGEKIEFSCTHCNPEECHDESFEHCRIEHHLHHDS